MILKFLGKCKYSCLISRNYITEREEGRERERKSERTKEREREKEG